MRQIQFSDSSSRKLTWSSNSTVTSLWYFSRAWDNHSLPSMILSTRALTKQHLNSFPAGRPHQSVILLLLLSAACCYLISHLIKTKPSIEALFSIHRSRGKSASILHEDHDASRNGLEEARPNRPGRWGIVVLAWAVATRIELFLFVQTQQQCSSFGFEVSSAPNACMSC